MPSIWATTTPELVGTYSSSCGSAKTLRVVFDVIVHITNCSVGNSDPRLRIVFFHGWNSNFNSVLKMLKARCDFQNRSNSRVSFVPSFRFRSWIVSWMSVFVTSYRMKKFTGISCHEVLSNFHDTHESCFLTEFIQSVFW